MAKPACVALCRRNRLLAAGFGLASWLGAHEAHAAVYSYVDWTSASTTSGTAAGTITLPDSSTVTVDFQAINANATPGTLYGAQINGGTNYWSPTTPYLSAEVENAPPTPDILQLSGGLNQTYQVTLSEPIKDPVMAIVSLGQPGFSCSYDFDAPFAIVSQGVGYWGGSATALSALPGDILQGFEGHGTIQFIGTFATFSWTVPTPESWHGFTFAIRTTERLEPTPDPGAGGADAGGAGNGDVSGGDTSTPGNAGQSNGDAAGAAGSSAATNGGSADTAMAGESSAAGGRLSTDRPMSGAGEGGVGDDDEHPLTKDEPGCNCTVAQGRFGTTFGTFVLLLSGLAARRVRRRRASPAAS